MNSDSMASSLKALKKAASVFGVMMTKDHDVLFREMPYDDRQVKELTANLDDIAYYLSQEGRAPDHLAFSYDGGNLVILFEQDYRIVVLHHNADEVDFITEAATAFFRDYLTGEAIKSLGFSAPAAMT